MIALIHRRREKDISLSLVNLPRPCRRHNTLSPHGQKRELRLFAWTPVQTDSDTCGAIFLDSRHVISTCNHPELDSVRRLGEGTAAGRLLLPASKDVAQPAYASSLVRGQANGQRTAHSLRQQARLGTGIPLVKVREKRRDAAPYWGWPVTVIMSLTCLGALSLRTPTTKSYPVKT